jgi:hypothetical protein
VTTTLSTCGFGDISATRGDSVESLAILFLQFFGMIFYSMTIQKIQSFFTSEEISSSEYANSMTQLTELLVVKAGRQMPMENHIQGEIIKQWRIYTMKYFQQSPDHFLLYNPLYHQLSENKKVQIVKQNLMLRFQEKYDTFFKDPEFGFKADSKLIASVCASLQYESLDSLSKGDSLLRQGVKSDGIFFLLDGAVNLHYKQYQHPFLVFEESVYFGEISFFFKTRNWYKYSIDMQNDAYKKAKMYSIKRNNLENIFDMFPDFKNMLLIRALRRQRYYRKMRR